MKKIVFQFLLFGFAALLGTDLLLAQTFYPTTMVKGQTTRIFISGSASLFNSASGSFIGYGPPQYFAGLNYGTPFVIHPGYATTDVGIPSNAPTGQWDLGLYYDFGYFPFSVPMTVLDPGVNTGLVSGYVRVDTNNNCLGQGRDNMLVRFDPGGFTAVTNASGYYSIWLPLGSYTATAMPSGGSPYTSMICPAAPYNINLTFSGQTVPNRNFKMLEQIVSDLEVTLITGIHRPGFPTTNYVTLSNLGPLPSPNTQLKILLDTLVKVGPSIPGGTFANDTLTINLGTIAGNSVQNIIFRDTTRINNTLGERLRFGVWASTSGTDANPANDWDTTSTVVVGSYDPNDKQVWTQDDVNADGPITPTDSLLRYLVRFQNTGTDTAFNVFILDTLDSDLDLGTLSILSASHAYVVNNKGGNVREFAFPDILLEDSTSNEPLSHGHIEFTLKRKPNLPPGTEISNSASIYFDFNAPVKTNTVTSKICPVFQLGFSSTTNQATATFSNTSTGTLGSFLWDFGDGNTSTASSPTHLYAAPGTYTVCLTMTDVCGSSTVCDSVVLTCTSPTAAWQSSANQLALAFTNQSSSSAFAWSWDFGDGNTSSQQNPNHTYASSGNYWVCLTVTDSCGQATYCDSVLASCTAPTASFTHTVSFYTTTFSDQSTSQGGATYLWNFGDGGTSTLQNPVHVYATSGTYIVSLTVSDVCDTDTYFDQVVVNCPVPNPVWSFTNSGLTVTFSNSTVVTPTMGYNWDLGDGTFSTLRDPVHTYASPGTYDVYLTVYDSCGADYYNRLVDVCPPHNSAFSYQPNGTQVAFTDITAGTVVSRNWDFGDGNTVNSITSPTYTHTYANPGTYTVCMSAINNCYERDTTCQVVTIVALEDGLFSWLKLYPNPNDGRFSLEADFMESGILTAKVHDLAGRTLFQTNLGEVQGAFRSNLDLELPAGTYFLHLELNGRRASRMFSIR